MNFLRNLAGLSEGTAAVDVLKYLAANIGGKLAAGILFVESVLYLVSPEIGNQHVQSFLGRLQVACILWLLVIMFWRNGTNAKLLRQTVALQTVANPGLANTSADPGVQREIAKLEQGGR